MNCKNCLHYERCKKLEIFNVETLSVCEDFTARSEWVHLPCKVGDKVYFLKNNTNACRCCDEYDGEMSYCYSTKIGYPELAERPICGKQFVEIVAWVADLMNIVENIDNFGRTVFLTREEAEKALEGMK